MAVEWPAERDATCAWFGHFRRVCN